MTDQSETEFKTLKLERDGHIARLTLTRPDLLNRIDIPSHGELIRAFRQIAFMQDIRVVIWSAQGKHFSAGGDLNEVYIQNKDTTARARMFQEARDIIFSLIDIQVPVIVALHGDTFGLGATLILLCDIIVATRKAKFGDPHVRIGLVAGDGGAIGWPASAGMIRAKRHLLTGKPVTGEEGLAMGLVSDLVETPEQCWEEAEKIAQEIVSLPPIAVQGTKRSLNTLLRRQAIDTLETSLLYEQQCLVSRDMLEAVQAFKERRQGKYEGH
jgi:enoyl-CoA hydratase